MTDFTLNEYRKLCLNLGEQGYSFVTFEEFYSNNLYLNGKKIIVMRHDVDRFPYHALKMAELENSLGIKSTYYFRYINSVFKENIIKKISSLGHEIGYHYETLSKTKGNKEEAISLFLTELEEFRKITPISTVCMHGSPLSPYDNRDLWKYYDFHDYGIIAEPYISLDYSNIEYFTDTSRTWGDSSLNFRDRVSKNEESTLTNTKSLIVHIQKRQPNLLIIQTHPERWAYSQLSYLKSLFLDSLTNLAKYLIKAIRR